MIEITAEVRAAIDRAAGDMELAGDEYIEPADGLIHCKKCRGSRQTVVPRFGGSGYFMPRCLCSCQQKAQEERKAMENSGNTNTWSVSNNFANQNCGTVETGAWGRERG